MARSAVARENLPGQTVQSVAVHPHPEWERVMVLA
jgi:hypothetical protein